MKGQKQKQAANAELRSAPAIPMIIAGAVVWLALVCLVYAQLLAYESTAGPISNTLPQWPPAAKISPRPGQFNLIVFVHPHCPCSRASLNELSKLMAHCPQINAVVLFLKPESTKSDWEKTDIWAYANNIVGVKVITDESGAESKKFGVHTSGETLLYSPSGQLLFAGGITSGRGHEGDNQGLDAVQFCVEHGFSSSRSSSPIFGCPLDDPSPEKE